MLFKKIIAIARYRTSQKCSIKCHINEELLYFKQDCHIIYFAATYQDIEFLETSSLDSQLHAKMTRMMIFRKNRLQINTVGTTVLRRYQWCQEPSRNQKPSWILVATRTLVKNFQKLFMSNVPDETNSGASISEVRKFQYNFFALIFPQFQKC